MDNSILFQFPQLLGKHFLGNAGQGPMELAKALNAVEQFPQDRDFPASANDADSSFHRTGEARMRLGSIVHSHLWGRGEAFGRQFMTQKEKYSVRMLRPPRREMHPIVRSIAAGEIR